MNKTIYYPEKDEENDYNGSDQDDGGNGTISEAYNPDNNDILID